MNADTVAPIVRIIFYSLGIIVALMLTANFKTREWKWVGIAFVVMTIAQLAGALAKALNTPEWITPLGTWFFTPALGVFVFRLTLALLRWRLHQ